MQSFSKFLAFLFTVKAPSVYCTTLFRNAAHYSHIGPEQWGVVLVIQIPSKNFGGHSEIPGKIGFDKNDFVNENGLIIPTKPPRTDNFPFQAGEEQHATWLESTFVVTHVLKVRNTER